MKMKNRVVVVHVFCVSVVNTYSKLQVGERLRLLGVIALTLYTTVPFVEFRVIEECT